MKRLALFVVANALAAVASNANAQEGSPTPYQQCLTWASFCATYYEERGFTSGAQCWDESYRDICTDTTERWDPVTNSYALYYGPIRMVWGQPSRIVEKMPE